MTLSEKLAIPNENGTTSRSRGWLAAGYLLALALFSVLLFANLGTYALWDDEANTALFAFNVWKYGDTVAWDGLNIVAFRNGLELSGLKNRAYPPAQYFFAAPWIGLLGPSAWSARIPFALTALVGFGFWAWWLWVSRAPTLYAIATFIAIGGNTSLFLYSRQARYYSLAWVVSIGLAYLYEQRGAARRNRWLLALGAALLLSIHYLTWGATMACLAFDQLFFQNGKDSWRYRLAFLGAQITALIVIVGVFWPFGRKVTPYVPDNWFVDKCTLLWWNLRDMNSCEFMWLPVLLLGGLSIACRRTRDMELLRGITAIVVYAAAVSLLSPQPVGISAVADIRYMAAIIPLERFSNRSSAPGEDRATWRPSRKEDCHEGVFDGFARACAGGLR